jgi:hypothetical protein
MKIPENERPDPATLEKYLDVSPEKLALFTVDLQNDCACESELYDSGLLRLAYWAKDGPRILDGPSRVRVPIHPGVLTDTTIDQLLKALDYEGEVTGVITANLAGWGVFVAPRIREPWCKA